MCAMKINKETQINPLGDDVLALTAIVRPILKGVLYALKRDVVNEVGGYDKIKLKMLPRLYKPGDGDVGISFEYAVHEALVENDARVQERVSDALKLCKLRVNDSPKSILFGMEKTGAIQLINTAHGLLTDESRTLPGKAGQPPKLRPRLHTLAAAFRREKARRLLPASIGGLWKADLFIGVTESQQWVGTSVKVNASQLEGAAGLRIGIIPTRQGVSDRIRLDESKGLVICPLHHDGDFMQSFYEAWRIVQAFIFADGTLPKEVHLPRPVDREICRMLVERREYPVIDVIDALKIFSQPELISGDTDDVSIEDIRGDTDTRDIVAPIGRQVS